MAQQDDGGESDVDWGCTPSRTSPSKSRSPSKKRDDPTWMMFTAERLEKGASAVQRAAASGGEDLRALYVMEPADIIKSASSQPPMAPISESSEYKRTSKSEARSHVETSYVLDRLTGGGYKKPDMTSGPFATALNPNRHTMMIQGRPVVVLMDEKHTHI